MSRIAAEVVLGVLLTLACAAPAQATWSGWRWSHPIPQGSSVNEIDFADGSRGYAVGDDGAALRTDDGGATWIELRTGTDDGFSRVQAVTRETAIFYVAQTILRTDDGGLTFSRIAGQDVLALYFPDPANGYLFKRGGEVLRTTDGGRTLTPVSPIPGSAETSEPGDAVFTSADAGIVFNSGHSRGYRTADGGRTWTPLAPTDYGFIDRIELIDGVLYAIGSASISRSTDGGQSWVKTAIKGAVLERISCGTADRCLLLTGRGDLLLTEDGGKTVRFVDPSRSSMRAVAFASPTRVVTGGMTGAMSASDDGGATFTPIGGRIATSFRFGLRLGPTPTTAYALGTHGQLGRTTDSGATWQAINVPTTSGIVDASFSTADDGYALTYRGGLFRTRDGGTTWTQTTTNGRPQAILATRDRLLVGSRPYDRAGSAIFAYDEHRVLRSTDGRTWHAFKAPKHLKDLDMVSATAGFALDTRGRVWRASNGSWTELPSVGTAAGISLAFTSASTGYLSVIGDPSDAVVLRTTDGGRHWRPQYLSTSPGPNARNVIALSDKRAIAVASGRAAATNSLFSTTTGGDAGTPTTITLTRNGRGRLSPARGGEQIIVATRTKDWERQIVTADAHGRFRFTARGQVVAQWYGDADRAGAGSSVLNLTQ